MNTRRTKATLALGLLFLLIPGRWAAAATLPPSPDGPAARAGVEPSTPDGGNLPFDSRAPHGTTLAPRATPSPPAPVVEAPLTLAFDPRLVEGASFYEVVGRPDLAAEYRSRHAWAVGLRTVGGLSLGLGVLAWVAIQAATAAFTVPFCAVGEKSACDADTGTLWVPDLMMAGGLALLIAPAFWSNDPVGPSERDALAREAAERYRHPRASVSFSPTIGGGGQISLSARF
jgi:hypothetical protein